MIYYDSTVGEAIVTVGVVIADQATGVVTVGCKGIVCAATNGVTVAYEATEGADTCVVTEGYTTDGVVTVGETTKGLVIVGVVVVAVYGTVATPFTPIV